MNNTRLSTQPQRCNSVRGNISIHILRSPWCGTNGKCLLSSSTDNIKICLLHVPRRGIQGICAESVLLQFTLTSVIYFRSIYLKSSSAILSNFFSPDFCCQSVFTQHASFLKAPIKSRLNSGSLFSSKTKKQASALITNNDNR